MVANGYFEHVSPGGQGLRERVSHTGWTRHRPRWRLAENIGWGTGSLATPTMAHIHQGDAQVAGPVVVALQAPVQNIADTCTQAAPALISQIVANPSGYYVNVHTADFPKGAIRAQLKRK